MDPKDSSDDITLFKEAIAIAESLHHADKNIKHYKDSKGTLKKLNRYDQEREKLRGTIKAMRSTRETKRQRLDDLQDGFIKKTTSKLVEITDIKGKLNKSLVPPDNMNIDDAFDMQPYLQQVNRLEKEVEELDTEKIDKLQLIQEIENCIDQTRTELQPFYEQSSLNCDPENVKYTADLNELNSRLAKYDRHAMIEKVTNMLLGEQLPKKENIAAMVDKAIRDMFGKKLVELVLQDQSKKENIYPSEVNSLQIREANSEETKSKIQFKIDIMKKEIDGALSIVEDVQKIEHLIENLGYADRITKNHAEVLNFLNAPDGNVNKMPYVNEAKDIPPEISLYEQNVNLSTALTTFLTQYTKNLYFSDFEERLLRLEKEIEQ